MRMRTRCDVTDSVPIGWVPIVGAAPKKNLKSKILTPQEIAFYALPR